MVPSRQDSHQATRERLLRAALEAFGQRDFDAVSVRQIVERAGANVAAVSYHFGGKQPLYLATAEFLAATMRARLGPTLDAITAQARDATPEVAAQLLRRLIGGLAGNLLRDRFGDDAAGLIVREQHQPSAAFDILYEQLMQPIQATFQRLVERIQGDAAGDERQRILITHALLGQVIGFRMARTTVLRRLGQETFDAADIERIAGLIADLTLNALRGDNLRTPPT